MRAVATTYKRVSGSWDAKKARIHKVLHCSSSANNGGSPRCGTTWNRDVNASLNILRLGVLDVFDIARPTVFCRKASPKQLARSGKATARLCGETRLVLALLSSASLAAPTRAQGIQQARVLIDCGTNPYIDLVHNLVHVRGVPLSDDL
jgi:hypothetical protein